METPVSLNVAPMNAPHKDLYYLLLVDKDFQIQDLYTDEKHLKVFSQARDNYLNDIDILKLWESTFPCIFSPQYMFSLI